MFVKIPREPVSIAKLFGPQRKRTGNPMGEAVFNRLQQELAQEEGSAGGAGKGSVQPKVEIPTPPAPSEEAPTKMELLLLKKQVLELQDELETERSNRETLFRFGSQLAQKLVSIYQLDAEEMKECIRLRIDTEIPDSFWQIQRAVWGPRTWRPLEKAYKEGNGRSLPDCIASGNEHAGADDVGLSYIKKFGKNWPEEEEEGYVTEKVPTPPIDVNILSMPEEEEDSTKQLFDPPTSPRLPKFYESSRTKPYRSEFGSSGGTKPGPSRPTYSMAPPMGMSGHGNSKTVHTESMSCLHKSLNFLRTVPSGINCIPELADRIPDLTECEVDIMTAHIEETSLECDRIMDYCDRINRMENISVSVTREIRSALMAAREVTEMAVTIADAVERRDEVFRQMPTRGGGENMAGMEI